MRQIPLTKGHFALVDDADYFLVSQFKWTYDKGYAVRKITLSPKKYKVIYLHRFLTNAQPGQLVDHADGNKLNHCRANLRICDGSLNNANRRVIKKFNRNSTSQYRGVYKDLRKDRWRAGIAYKGRRYWLGYFQSETEAAKAYDAKAKELFGKFAVPNFPNKRGA